jgi:hypothetical protein
MISVNISTIKQYFWYYDNFNKNINLDHGGKRFLPILKVNHICYIFSDKTKLTFDNLQKNFVTYDKIYTYMVIDANQNIQCDIETIFKMFQCVFIDVNENLIWSIIKNDILIGNKFYEQMIKNNENISFTFPKKKQISGTKINLLDSITYLGELPSQHLQDPVNIIEDPVNIIEDPVNIIEDPVNIIEDLEHLETLKHALDSFQIFDKYIERPKSRQLIELNSVEFESGIPDPFFDDFVIIDDPNSADL